jgi:L-lactate dehydrogenase complex protein LldG
LPQFEPVFPVLLESFAANLERMGGELIAAPADADLDELIRRRYPEARVVCSATPEVAGTRPIDEVRAPAELDDVDVGVVRAAFGIAETGSVLLTESHFRINALGFLAQHLVVLLDPSSIVADLHQAYRDRSFSAAGYAVFLTGPSATADIEGVLVRGAQGARSLTVVTCPQRRG